MSPPASPAPIPLAFFAEDQPGPEWLAGALAYWPRLKAWLAPYMTGEPPALEEGRAALARHMPELLPVWQRLQALLPPDETARRLLAHWGPPAVFAGCSVACLPGPPPVLLRNYDFDPARFEGRVWLSRLTGTRVLASLEGLWGALDGVGERGLAAALTYGGGPEAGPGFSGPMIVRYLLETCADTAEARTALARLPSAHVQNVALLDRAGTALVAYLHPHRPARFEATGTVTNHQPGDAPDDEPASGEAEDDPASSRARLAALRTHPPEPARFLEPPLYADRPDHRTLYTAAYAPAEGTARFLWPGREVGCGLTEGTARE